MNKILLWACLDATPDIFLTNNPYMVFVVHQNEAVYSPFSTRTSDMHVLCHRWTVVTVPKACQVCRVYLTLSLRKEILASRVLFPQMDVRR